MRKAEPILDSEGNVKEFKHRGMYFFVHNKKIRESYDTYKVIDRFSKVGFQENRIDNSNTINNINLNIKKLKK